ncbi:hypothetical protein C7974DRAFT_171421 [Boeremia exigua]|uniref:uncharacterized protein n=1 Tax=Boeremia exigua TaxID=749465 RepID=UPI001E8D2F2C|nr:uncharacterized protein C7974DRAFT_171421 [Boeremia exigua]KAH6633440.1 hypothetical protein C7974DRAFT_171421 [Boeremia exigua]
MQRYTARKAATAARSQIAASAKQAADYESDSDDEIPTLKKAPVIANSSITAVRNDQKVPEWYIAIDFGTTFTTVAFHRRGAPTERIFTIDDFPGEKELHLSGRQIPTELWYPKINARPSSYVKSHDIRLRFGNEVHRLAEDADSVDIHTMYDDSDRVTMMKLLLDHTDYARASKERLQEKLEIIKAEGHINENEDVLFHFFREVLRASKTRLGFDFNGASTVEVIFCVPVCYNPSAVAVLGAQIERAMKEVRFGTDGESPCHMFVVHEAEAQAMQALQQAHHQLQRNQTFMLVDCGGGTTDIGVYRIAGTEPLRLENEVYEATGAMVGAGDLNNMFRNLAKRILRHELYLESGEDTIDTIIEAEAMYKFEHDLKRNFKYNDIEQGYGIRIRGLKRSQSDTRIRDNYLVLTYQDMWSIFKPSVEKIGRMMEDAIVYARLAGYAVSKIVVAGGFSDSPCLTSYLAQQTDQLSRKLEQQLDLRFSSRNLSATGVATGAILRAINKANGPSRIPCQSIGVLRRIPCDDDNEDYAADVLRQPRKWSTEEAKEYVMDTIFWVVKKNHVRLESVYTVRFDSEHVFQPHETEWIIEEQLWASESCTLDFFKVDHANNAGKTMQIGAVEFDISDMRQEIRAANREAREKINKVVIMVEMTVIDRNLEFTARWPATPEGQVIRGSRKFFSVASAFTPGTQ